MADIAICAIFKNESRYLYEWLSYHYNIGIRKFVLYDNGSIDDSVAVIRNWPRSNAVKLIDWPYARGQITAYIDMLTNQNAAAEWCAFIDCDEFLCPTADVPVSTFIDGLPSSVSGLYVHWYMFGSSGHVRRPEGLVTETYTKRAPDEFGSHYYGKSIVRLQRATKPGIHVFQCEGPVVNDSGDLIDQASIGFQKRRSHSYLSLNHYFTKSLEEWRVRRALGRASKAAGDDGFMRPETEFHQHDVNDVIDVRAANIMASAREDFYFE